MAKAQRKVAILAASLLCFVLPALAQVSVGDNTNLSLSGNLSAGYSGSFGDTLTSSHGLSFGGNGQLGGYYYNPKFVSFNLQPYYNRSQNNSAFQSITNSSGFIGDVQIFSGSRFPGSVSYTKSLEGSGQFGIPGIDGFTTHGGSQTFGITWSALLPHLPTLTANFTNGGSHFEVFGANGESDNHNRNFSLQSSYSLAGFRLNGMFLHQGIRGSFPGLLDSPTHSTDNSVNTFVFQTGHALPWRGQWNLGWNRSTFSTGYRTAGESGGNDGNVTTLNSSVTLNPLRKLTTVMSSSYTTNVFGGLQREILLAGGTISQSLPSVSSSAVIANGAVYYQLFSHLSLNSQVTHQHQFFQGESLGATQYGGGANFNLSRPFLGSLYFSLNLVDTATDRGNTGAALVGNVNFGRKVGRWDLGAYFSYSQQIQTLLDVYTTSGYNYAANVRRRFSSGLQWSGNFHSSHSGFMRIAGSNNHSEGVSSNLTYGHFAVNGVWSRAGGLSLLTPQGLVPVPGGIPINLLTDQIVYSGQSYGVGGAFSFKRFIVTVNYTKADSTSLGAAKTQKFNNRLIYGRLQYRLRKLYLNAGLTNLQQSFTATNGVPTQYVTYFFGVSRWFNVF